MTNRLIDGENILGDLTHMLAEAAAPPVQQMICVVLAEVQLPHQDPLRTLHEFPGLKSVSDGVELVPASAGQLNRCKDFSFVEGFHDVRISRRRPPPRGARGR